VKGKVVNVSDYLIQLPHTRDLKWLLFQPISGGCIIW